MAERASAPGCARANDLVALLYDEINEDEARDFELHLQNCSECKLEFLGFRQLRQSIVAWRDDSLSVIPTSVVGRNSLSVSAGLGPVSQKNRSAVFAVQQFFALSPLWMKSAVAFASVLFCIVASLAVFHLLEKSPPALVASERLYTEGELKAKIAEGIQSLAQPDVRNGGGSPAPNVVRIGRQQEGNRRPVRPFGVPVFDSPRALRRPLTKSEREQLAADLRLTSPDDEEGLDLLDDRLSK